MKKSRKNKFLLVGTSTILVASAIAPVALAKPFTDVTPDNSHKVGIDYLSDRNIISGYSDGKIKPSRQLSRSDVVKMMGKYLVEEGYSIPSNYKTVMCFKDLSSKSSDELLKYAALVYDQGLFQGSNNYLMYKNPISRKQMATVLSCLVSKQYNIADLINFAMENGGTLNVTDLNEAAVTNRDKIMLLDLLEITNVTEFRPNGTTTRGQFSSFVYRTLENNMINKFKINQAVPLNKTKVAADGRSISFEGVVAGTNIKVWNGRSPMLGNSSA